MELVAGTKIADRYVVERALAKGGMGAVYVATDTRMNASVALKVTAAGGAAADVLAGRFAREARIGHRLGSRRQGFVRASDWGRIDDVRLYLVMDLVENAKPLDLAAGTLDERLGRWRRAAELVRVAHEQGVIHRDLKPANFLQAPDESIFLTDFGLAKVVGEGVDGSGEAISLTLSGVGFGTPPYMPPEQLEDAKHADERADVFALGCMLFEAAVLRLPYPGPAPTAVMSAHMKVRAGLTPAPRPRDIDASIPEALDQACVQALELDAARRAPSVAALLAVLDGGADGGTARSLTGIATTPPASPTLSGASTVRPVEGPPSLQPSSGPKRALAAIGVLLVVLMAGAVAADMGGLRTRVVGVVDAPTTTTERPPQPPSEPPQPAPTVTLVELSLKDGAVVSALSVDVTGRIDPPAGAVRVAGIACPVGRDGTFALRRLSLDPGANQVTVEVRPDAAGQEPSRRTVMIQADADDPLLTIDVPADGLETASAMIDLRGRIDDATPVEVSIDGEIVARVKAGGGAFSTQVALPALAARAIEVVARDAAGRTTRVTRTVVRRAARLEVTLDAPADESDTNAPQVRLAGRVTGDAAPATLEVRIEGVVVRTDASGAFDEELPLTEGEHALEVAATGAGPGGDPISARASRRVRVDRTAPALRVLTPESGGWVGVGVIDVRAEVTDAAAWVDVSLGAGEPTRVPRGQAFSGRVTLDVGATEIVLVATDPAGNRSEARQRVERWTPGRPLPWSLGPARLPAGVVRGAFDGEYVNERDGSVLLYVPPGTFRMGSDAGGDDNERPVHEVRLTRGYFIGKFEVTWAQYRAFCRARDRQPGSNVIDDHGRFEASDQHPVFHVDYDDVQAYCEWAGLRLPSEAEWEYAARGTDGRAYPWGNEPPGTTRCNTGSPGLTNPPDYRDGRDGHLFTAPVGSFAGDASAFGALDMAGNVSEWVRDWYADTFPPGVQIDPDGPATGTERVHRGGGFLGGPRACSTTKRGQCWPGHDKDFLGFRIARPAEDPDAAPGTPARPAAPTEAPSLTPGPLPWSRGPARLPAGVVRGTTDGEYVNERDGSVLLYVPPGTFRMGSDAGGANNERPVHEVRLTRGYFIGKFEVTWAQYRVFCRTRSTRSPSNVIVHPLGRFEAPETHPVFNVTWDGAQAYCEWAGLRLPSEAEWEFAARGADDRIYPWGNQVPGATRCNGDGRGPGDKTRPVGSFAAGSSAFGALDMAGNVREWVQDWFAGYRAGSQIDPSGPAPGSVFRATRGGSWYTGSANCRATSRLELLPDSRDDGLGFRVARSAADR